MVRLTGSTIPSAQGLRAQFDNKVRRGIFRPVARFLREDIQEERLQDAIAQTWRMYQHYALDKGVILVDAILVHSCRQRAVDLGRRFVGVEHQPKCDVFDERNYHRGKVELVHVDGCFWDLEDARETDGYLIGLAEELYRDPTSHILSAIDLEEWIASLRRRDQRLLVMKLEGFTLKEIATRLRLSISTVFNRGRELGKELAARAGVAIAIG